MTLLSELMTAFRHGLQHLNARLSSVGQWEVVSLKIYIAANQTFCF